jgi:hypothetical protein
MSLQDVALGITHLCVRNTVIEQYHADGKLTDAEMKEFNKEVANKLYTALLLLTSRDPEESEATFSLFASHRPYNWDPPEIDQGIRKAVVRTKQEPK